MNRTREKYESDCIKINAFTGQSALVQGRELDKLHLKLEKLQETVKINEREFGNFVRALADTTRKWDDEWKKFCDVCCSSHYFYYQLIVTSAVVSRFGG